MMRSYWLIFDMTGSRWGDPWLRKETADKWAAIYTKQSSWAAPFHVVEYAPKAPQK